MHKPINIHKYRLPNESWTHAGQRAEVRANKTKLTSDKTKHYLIAAKCFERDEIWASVARCFKNKATYEFTPRGKVIALTQAGAAFARAEQEEKAFEMFELATEAAGNDQEQLKIIREHVVKYCSPLSGSTHPLAAPEVQPKLNSIRNSAIPAP